MLILSRRPVMDLRLLLKQLRLEKERIDRKIARLEQLHDTGDGVMPKRRGRKSMSDAESRVVSERMKRYWAGRRSQKAG